MSNSSNSAPAQAQIDAVAHFIQAARQLAAAPLLSEDHGSIKGDGYVNSAGEVEVQNITLPSVMVRDSTLLPFRRMWMQNEPCFYGKILATVKRYSPELRPAAEHLETEMKKCLRSHGDPWFARKTSRTPEQIIDLWVNAKLAHCGATTNPGRFDRHDFEKYQAEAGNLAFEALFIQAVQTIAGCFIGLKELAESLLNDIWMPLGLTPSFSFQDFDQDGTHALLDGTSITRSSPGLVVSQESESPAHCVLRLIERVSFNMLKSFFEILCEPLDVSMEALAQTLLTSKGLERFLETIGLKPRETAENPAAATQMWAKLLDRETQLICQVVVFDTKEIFLDENARKVLEGQMHRILANQE